MNDEIEKYKQALAGHDWFYGYSEDYDVFCRGDRNNQLILTLRQKLDPDWTIWDQFAPQQYKHNKETSHA